MTIHDHSYPYRQIAGRLCQLRATNPEDCPTLADLVKQSGCPRRTLQRRLYDHTCAAAVYETLCLAHALDMDFADLLPQAVISRASGWRRS